METRYWSDKIGGCRRETSGGSRFRLKKGAYRGCHVQKLEGAGCDNKGVSVIDG